VWEKPTTLIARELKVSDKAVEKRCHKLGIHKPHKGYWAKKSQVAQSVEHRTVNAAGLTPCVGSNPTLGATPYENNRI
jgi:3-deoxy-D-manno-octulosonate 8-phosphate phosphatase KdsC-like HAD superfamily phosphatase